MRVIVPPYIGPRATVGQINYIHALQTDCGLKNDKELHYWIERELDEAVMLPDWKAIQSLGDLTLNQASWIIDKMKEWKEERLSSQTPLITTYE